MVTVSLRQQIVPSDLLGRVNSVYRMLGWGLMPVGALARGFVAHAAGLRAPYVVAGILCGLGLLAALPLLLAADRSPPAYPPSLICPNDPWLTCPYIPGRCGWKAPARVEGSVEFILN